GPGLIKMLTDAALKNGIKIKYDSRAVALIYENGRVNGVRIRKDDGLHELRARSVILACGGFEANAEMRTRYLGPGWDLAKVRGSRWDPAHPIPIPPHIRATPPPTRPT